MRHRYPGFTLIEVLIVVVIMAVLAATIIPQFTSSTTDAKRSARDFNVHSLQAQIELYRIDHGAYPTATELTDALTMASDKDGATQATPDDTHPYGPYIIGGTMPKNPMNNLNTIIASASAAPTAESGTGGWLYYTDATATTPGTVAKIWPNDADYWDNLEE
jgi:general secretion pathway protein G